MLPPVAPSSRPTATAFPILAALGMALCTALPAAAQESEGESFLAAMREGTVRLDLRYRFELVDQEGVPETGYASTLRTAFGYRSGRYRGFDFVLQAVNVSDLGAADLHANAGFGSAGNRVSSRPVIADAPRTAIGEGFLRYSDGDTTVAAGRQEILHGDQRFVGSVGWRQQHQSFRAVRLTESGLDRLKLDYAFVDRVHRLTGATQDAAIHLLSAAYEIPAAGTLAGYAYLLDFDAASGLSTATFGAEWKGMRVLPSGLALSWEAEYAHQSDSGDNPADVSASYLHLAAGIARSGYRVTAGWERLGGEPGQGAFTTTLGTLHAFNGWADRFLATPADGLEDLYVRVQGPLGPLSAVAVYHDFRAASADTRYGHELDFQLLWSSPWEQGFGLKGAFYRADGFATDTTKLWIFTTLAL